MIALVATSKSNLIGFVCARPDDVGMCVGPLIADDPKVAEALLKALETKLAVGTSYVIDVPEKVEAKMAPPPDPFLSPSRALSATHS